METGHKEIRDILGLIVKLQTKKANTLINLLKTKRIENGQKIQALAGIDKILNNKRDSEERLIDLVLLQSFKGYNISREQRKSLLNLKEALESIKTSTVDCPHNSLEIYKLMHGGGFTPTMLLPELVCRDCGVNITLPPLKVISEYGIKITDEFVTNLEDYLIKRKDDVWMGVENILSNPNEVFKNVKKMPSLKGLIIVDKHKLDSFSGK